MAIGAGLAIRAASRPAPDASGIVLSSSSLAPVLRCSRNSSLLDTGMVSERTL